MQTGDLHIAVYDLPNEIVFVSNARADDESRPLPAYDRYAQCRRREGRREWKERGEGGREEEGEGRRGAGGGGRGRREGRGSGEGKWGGEERVERRERVEGD